MKKKNYSKVVLIPLRHKHHAKASGYERIREFIPGKVIPDREVVDELFWRIVARIFRNVCLNSGNQWYSRKSMVRELKAAIHWVLGKKTVFHFFYGENSYRYFGALKFFGKRNYIICTYHTPPDRFNEVINNHEHVKTVDGLIVLSTMAVDYFSSIVGADNVYYVPRSVDVEYFKPPEIKLDSETFDCLFVGSHLRDFKTLENVAKILWGIDESIAIIVVAPKSCHDDLCGLKNVILLDKISDQELLEYYQQSQILLFPLIDATANNVVVEAMACGLPIVATDLVGVRDYVDDSCGLFAPKYDAEKLSEHVLTLKRNVNVRKKMSLRAIEKAQEFSIRNIALLTQDVYQDIASR